MVTKSQNQNSKMPSLKTVAIMQPYLFPYIGYFQLIAASDIFVFYDDSQYLKGGWVNRNRLKKDGTDHLFSIPVVADHFTKAIKDRFYHDEFYNKISSIIAYLKIYYKKAPYLESTLDVLDTLMKIEDLCISNVNIKMLEVVCQKMKLNPHFFKSSELGLSEDLRGVDKVISIVQHFKGNQYINPIGGKELYDKQYFESKGIDLKFIRSQLSPYPQGKDPFLQGLSILDVLSYCSDDEIQTQLKDYDLE